MAQDSAERFLIERTYDWDEIKRIAIHPKVYEHISDDFSPPAENWQPIQDKSVVHLLAKAEKVLGLFVFIPDNAICWKIHVCLLPEGYGRVPLQLALDWIWANTECRRVVGEIPEYNRLAIRYALGAMKQCGRNHKSHMKNGKLWDRLIFGVSKPWV